MEVGERRRGAAAAAAAQESTQICLSFESFPFRLWLDGRRRAESHPSTKHQPPPVTSPARTSAVHGVLLGLGYPDLAVHTRTRI